MGTEGAVTDGPRFGQVYRFTSSVGWMDIMWIGPAPEDEVGWWGVTIAQAGRMLGQIGEVAVRIPLNDPDWSWRRIDE